MVGGEGLKVPFTPYIQGRNAYPDRDGRKYGVAVHCTANDASARDEAAFAAHRTDGVSTHLLIDPTEVIQSLDTKDRAGHAGSFEGNEHAICLEFVGTNGKGRAWWLANICWDLLGRVMAEIIRSHWPDGSFQVRRATVAQMKANPKIKALYAHDDMRLAWGNTTHTDPGPNFPWDRLFKAINDGLGSTTGDDDMFCRHGDTGPKVEALQRVIVAAGGSVGVTDGKPDIDGSFGDKTAAGLKALVGSGDGKYYGPTEYAALHVALARRNGSGTPGPQGPVGPPGKTPTTIRISGDFPVTGAV
jgi:N-acetyl-anhydromuramyl-L-alanine amidase AmpD